MNRTTDQDIVRPYGNQDIFVYNFYKKEIEEQPIPN